MSGSDPTHTYRQEAADLLEQLESDLLSLEGAPGNQDLVDGIFRALHTIKGSGAMCGFERVAAFTHHLETAFDTVRKGHAVATPELIALTLAARDHIGHLIEQPDTTNDAAGIAILAELSGLLMPAAAAPVATTWRLRIRLPRDAMATGTNPLLLLDELRELGPCTIVADTDAIPPLEELKPTDCYVGWDVTLTTDRPRSAIEQVFLFVQDDSEIQIAPLDEAVASAAPAAAPAATPRGEVRAIDSIRVSATCLDALMDRVGELVIAQSRLKQIASASSDMQVKSAAEDIERLALELRDTTMGARMVPIGQLFGRFRRLVHDLARDLNKEIAVVFSGEETELDKTLIEHLADPLIHLIRNCADHGIESPEQRAAAGKPAQGRITLAARHLGHEVLISISDDGRGLDRARIRQRGEEQGLLAAGATPSEAELFGLLFQPGFSTAREVSSLSGRGVGLDVVRRAIMGLRGSIDIASKAGHGTEITLRLPLTLAIIDGLLVRVGGGRYVIPLSAVEECVELDAAEDARTRGRSFLNIRGSLVPYLRLREIFATKAPLDPYQKVVIVSAGDLRVGLVVDQVIGNHQTVIKSLSRLHASLGTFSGATILGDGTVALILEVSHLLAVGQGREERFKAAS